MNRAGAGAGAGAGARGGADCPGTTDQSALHKLVVKVLNPSVTSLLSKAECAAFSGTTFSQLEEILDREEFALNERLGQDVQLIKQSQGAGTGNRYELLDYIIQCLLKKIFNKRIVDACESLLLTAEEAMFIRLCLPVKVRSIKHSLGGLFSHWYPDIDGKGPIMFNDTDGVFNKFSISSSHCMPSISGYSIGRNDFYAEMVMADKQFKLAIEGVRIHRRLCSRVFREAQMALYRRLDGPIKSVYIASLVHVHCFICETWLKQRLSSLTRDERGDLFEQVRHKLIEDLDCTLAGSLTAQETLGEINSYFRSCLPDISKKLSCYSRAGISEKDRYVMSRLEQAKTFLGKLSEVLLALNAEEADLACRSISPS